MKSTAPSGKGRPTCKAPVPIADVPVPPARELPPVRPSPQSLPANSPLAGPVPHPCAGTAAQWCSGFKIKFKGRPLKTAFCKTYGLTFRGRLSTASRGTELHLAMLLRLCHPWVGLGSAAPQLSAVDEGSRCSRQLPLVASAYEGPNNILHEGFLRRKKPYKIYTGLCWTISNMASI